MSTGAREHYDWIVPQLIKDRVVCNIDIPLICAACDFYARFQSAESLTDKKNAIAMYERIMASYGMTYKARRAMGLMKEEKKDGDDPAFGGLFDDER